MMALTAMDKLLFWLGIGAAQRGAESKALDRRNRALSFAVGTLLALLTRSSSRSRCASVPRRAGNFANLFMLGSTLAPS